GVATESEFRVLRDYFSAEGYEATIADPCALTYDRHYLFAGHFRVDIVYKRVVIHEFLERCDDDHPLARAYADRRICMVNSFRTKLAHKKASFAILSDPKCAKFFTPEEIDVIHKHIPWTRRVAADTTMFENSERDLIEVIRREQQRLVLKPNDDYGGHGVFIRWENEPPQGGEAIFLAPSRPHVITERAPLKKIPMPTFFTTVKL